MSHFKRPEAELLGWLESINKIFNEYEDLPYPSVVAINGFALGGGFEIALTADYRVVNESARIGLPETQLGIMPGWGGTVRSQESQVRTMPSNGLRQENNIRALMDLRLLWLMLW